jgi:hypothetical protein
MQKMHYNSWKPTSFFRDLYVISPETGKNDFFFPIGLKKRWHHERMIDKTMEEKQK